MPSKKVTGLTAAHIAEKINAKLLGDGAVSLTSLSSLDEGQSGALVFISQRSIADTDMAVAASAASAFLVHEKTKFKSVPKGKAVIAVPDPMRALIKTIPLFFEAARTQAGVSPRAEIDPSAKIGQRVSIGAFCVVGPGAVISDDVTLHPHVTIYQDAKIGARSIIHSHAVIREECEIGADCVIQNGAVIGGDGFGYIPDPVLGLVTVPQIGVVRTADRVDIGANACIDRAAFGSTRVGLGSKIDNLVQIAHNTRVGRNSIICGLSGIAGSCDIGNNVIVGGACGMADHLTLADGVRLGGRTGVVRSLTEKGDYEGFPAVPAGTWRRWTILLERVSELAALLRKEKK